MPQVIEHKVVKSPLPVQYYERSAWYAYANTLIPLFCLLVVLGWAAPRGHGVITAGLLFLLTGFLQYRLYFPLHDCSHLSLFRTDGENRFWGHLLAGLLFTSFERFRREHLLHHRTYGTREDPGSLDYWRTPHSKRQMLAFLLSPLVGGGLFHKIKCYYGFVLSAGGRGGGKAASWYGLVVMVAIQAAVMLYTSSFFAHIHRYFLFYLLPALTIFLFLSRLRMFMEHASLDYGVFDYESNPRITARTIPSVFPENQLFCAMNFNFHHEHHVYPQAPSCRLRRIHGAVTKCGIEACDYEPTYVGALIKLWRTL